MRIGVNTLFLIPGEVGGTETYLCQTLTAILRSQQAPALVLFTNRENDGFLRKELREFNQVEFVELGFAASNRYSRIIREQVQLPPLVKKSRVDVLWSPGYTAPFFSACPQVVTIPDMQYKSHPEDMTSLAMITTDILVKAAVKRCRRIIAISEFSKQEVTKFTGADPNSIDITHLAAAATFSERISESERSRVLKNLGTGDGKYLLCVANSYPHKNIHALVEAFGELLAEIPHRLVIVGKKRFGESRVLQAIDKLADKSRVCRIERVAAEELPAVYQAADLFVFPSLYEGFGLPVLEAMTAGVPVVATRKASIPEIGGECLFYSEDGSGSSLASQIRGALSMSAARRAEWCQKAAARAKSFSWQTTADKTVECLRKAAARR